MLCFMDKTFCNYYESCEHGDVCSRALTDKVKADAISWWHGFMTVDEAPICVFAEKPECYKEIAE